MTTYDLDTVPNLRLVQNDDDLYSIETSETPSPAADSPAPVKEKHMPAELLGTDVAPVSMLGVRALANIPPIEWLVDSHVPAGLLTTLWGQGASYKSFLALDWALCVASGTSWKNCPVEKGPVVYVSGEGASGLYGRVDAWERKHPHADTRLFAVVPHAIRLLDEMEVKRLRKSLHSLTQKPKLIVIDTLQRSMAGLGDENSTQDMSRIIAVLDDLRAEFNCSILIVHHSGADGERARGSVVLRNSCDAMWKLKRDGTDTAPAHTATLYCDKLKDGEEPPARKLVAEASGASIILAETAATVELTARSKWDARSPF